MFCIFIDKYLTMAKEIDYELQKMLNLMGRMDQHMTGSEAQALNEAARSDLGIGRINYSDIDDFFNNVKIGKGTFVGISYLQGYEAQKIYPLKNGFEDKLRGEYDKMEDNRGKGKIEALLNNPELKTPTGRANSGFRSVANSNIQGYIKATNYVLNWTDAEGYKNAFEKNRLDNAEIRRKFGFGEEDSFYADDDWHRNPIHGGIFANKPSTDKRKTDNGNNVVAAYSQLLNPEISMYGDNDSEGNPRMTTRPDGTQYQKRAFKLVLNNVHNQWAHYYLVDNNGEIDAVANNLAYLFTKAPQTSALRKKITDQMSKDEVEYINAMADLEDRFAKQTKTFNSENILCIVATGTDRYTGEKLSYRWINPDININKIQVDPNELDKIVSQETEQITKKTATA